MNDHLTLNMKTKRDSAPDVRHRCKGQRVEQSPELFPQAASAADFVPSGLKERTRELLGLIYRKGQHHQQRKNDGQIVVAMPKVVFKMIALVLEGVVGLIFDLPAGATPAHQRGGIVLGDHKVRNPSEMLDLISLDFPVLQEVDPDIRLGGIEGDVIEVTEALSHARDLPLKLSRLTPRVGLVHIIKQMSMIARLDAQDEMQLVALEFANMGSVGTQRIFDNDKGSVGIVFTEVGEKAFSRIPFTIILFCAILFDDRFGT